MSASVTENSQNRPFTFVDLMRVKAFVFDHTDSGLRSAPTLGAQRKGHNDDHDIGAASKIMSISRSKPISVPSTFLAGPGRTLPPGYIHLGVAKEIAPTLRGFGIDPDPVIREAGLNPSLFDDGTNVIPYTALGRLLNLSVARTNCPYFGLLVGTRATILSFGMVGRMMQHSETVGDVLTWLLVRSTRPKTSCTPKILHKLAFGLCTGVVGS